MSVVNFVLFVTLLTFIIGLSVAAIIWGINRMFSPADHPDQDHHENKLHQIISEYRKMQRQAEGNNVSVEDDFTNKELYAYHHGKN